MAQNLTFKSTPSNTKMKKPIKGLFHGQKFLLILGLVVSILAVSKSDMYSTSGVEQYLPDFSDWKKEIKSHITTDNQSGQTNLNNGNFIACYIQVISNRPENQDEKCEKPGALQTFKNRMTKIFSSI